LPGSTEITDYSLQSEQDELFAKIFGDSVIPEGDASEFDVGYYGKLFGQG
jgi:hypothetical protein